MFPAANMLHTKTESNAGIIPMRALVRKALPTLKWRHHGIGCLQAYLVEDQDPEIRVHIWAPELVKQGITNSGDAHDHRFVMVSHVLEGVVHHEEIDTTPHPGAPYTIFRVPHARSAAAMNFSGPIEPTHERYEVTRRRMKIHHGTSYRFEPKQFHRAWDVQFAVTCVEKYAQTDDKARVLHPVDIPPVMAFGHKTDNRLLAKILQVASERLA